MKSCWFFFTYSCDRLYKLQKKVLRIITNSKFNAHTEPLFKTLGILKLNDIYKLNVLKFYFLHCNDQLPRYLQNFAFIARSDIHGYDTRAKADLNVNRTRTRLAENSLRNVTPVIVNEFPNVVTDKIRTHSLQGFVMYVKQYLNNKYASNCNIRNCYVCGNALQ